MGKLLQNYKQLEMQNLQVKRETQKQSDISAFSISMTVS